MTCTKVLQQRTCIRLSAYAWGSIGCFYQVTYRSNIEHLGGYIVGVPPLPIRSEKRSSNGADGTARGVGSRQSYEIAQ